MAQHSRRLPACASADGPGRVDHRPPDTGLHGWRLCQRGRTARHDVTALPRRNRIRERQSQRHSGLLSLPASLPRPWESHPCPSLHPTPGLGLGCLQVSTPPKAGMCWSSFISPRSPRWSHPRRSGTWCEWEGGRQTGRETHIQSVGRACVSGSVPLCPHPPPLPMPPVCTVRVGPLG